jgi:hypothetical protein
MPSGRLGVDSEKEKQNSKAWPCSRKTRILLEVCSLCHQVLEYTSDRGVRSQAVNNVRIGLFSAFFSDALLIYPRPQPGQVNPYRTIFPNFAATLRPAFS